MLVTDLIGATATSTGIKLTVSPEPTNFTGESRCGDFAVSISGTENATKLVYQPLNFTTTSSITIVPITVSGVQVYTITGFSNRGCSALRVVTFTSNSIPTVSIMKKDVRC